jgi:hypothetical protein
MCSNGSEETLKHLFFECEFVQSCWTTLHIVWDLSTNFRYGGRTEEAFPIQLLYGSYHAGSIGRSVSIIIISFSTLNKFRWCDGKRILEIYSYYVSLSDGMAVFAVTCKYCTVLFILFNKSTVGGLPSCFILKNKKKLRVTK